MLPGKSLAHQRIDNTIRVAVFNVNLSGRGPGVILRDLKSGSTDADRMAQIIQRTAPDILILTKIDYDLEQRTLKAFLDLLAAMGHDMPHTFALRPNSGWATGRDMDGDGRSNTPDDAHGYGAFAGAGGMAVVSRLPILHDQAEDFSSFLWADLPGNLMPPDTPQPTVQRLSSTGHWRVPIQITDDDILHVLVFYATPPVFGHGPQRNLTRNHDEVAFWTRYLDGALAMRPPTDPVVIAGSANLDPIDGDGMHTAMQQLLTHPRLQDPAPQSTGGEMAGDHPASAGHLGNPALDTTEWTRDIGPGNLRVDYVLPDASLPVVGSGVFWPSPDSELRALLGQGDDVPTRHRLVWVDLAVH